MSRRQIRLFGWSGSGREALDECAGSVASQGSDAKEEDTEQGTGDGMPLAFNSQTHDSKREA